MKRFVLNRLIDDTGIVAEGVQFSNGKCVLTWLTTVTSVGVYDTIEDLVTIHCHGGHTQLTWIEEQ